MRKVLLSILLLFILAACQPAAVSGDVFARQWLDSSGKKDVKVTKLVQGNAKYQKADEVDCVETDATTPDGQAFIFTIARKGSTWSGAPMTDGEYEWDLNGCPR